MNTLPELIEALSMAPDGVKITVFPTEAVLAEITAKAQGVGPSAYLQAAVNDQRGER